MAKQTRSKRKPKGLGDVIENITEATGIKAIVEAFTPEGKDCGCDKRKEKLNKLFPIKTKANCFTKEQHDTWKLFKEVRTIRITHEQILMICELYSNIFNLPYWKPSCFACSGTARTIGTMIDKLDVVYNTYEN
jgi:hypothetical protein